MLSIRASIVAVITSLAACALAGCAETSPAAEASESNLTGGSGGSSTLADCAGRKECIDAFALKTLFGSSLTLRTDCEPTTTSAAEFVSGWLQNDEHNYRMLHVKTEELAAGTLKVDILVSMESREDGEDGGFGIGFSFTIDGETVVEQNVEGWCAG